MLRVCAAVQRLVGIVALAATLLAIAVHLSAAPGRRSRMRTSTSGPQSTVHTGSGSATIRLAGGEAVSGWGRPPAPGPGPGARGRNGGGERMQHLAGLPHFYQGFRDSQYLSMGGALG